tara:strand:- start:8458 stop:9339 length:882 start_codon:yes stop_codon:yes gene_type:complete
MFTPEGYWAWPEMIEQVESWTHDIVVASIEPALSVELAEARPSQVNEIIIEKLIAKGFVDNPKDARFAIQILELWVLANVMDTFDAVLCSPTGVRLECPPMIKTHGDAFDWWSWPLSRKKIDQSEAHGYFENFRKGQFSILDAQARFCVIDYETGLIKLKPNSTRLLYSSSYGHGDTHEGLQDFLERQVRPLIGWSICWNPESLPETEQELFDRLGFSNLDWETFNKGNQDLDSGQTAHDYVLQCVMTAFPDGKNGATWKVVEEKVGYSRRSIVTALKREGTYSDWATSISPE